MPKNISYPETCKIVEGYIKGKSCAQIAKINMQENHHKYDNLVKTLIN